MEPFIGQIQPFGFNFAPRGWAMCNGQLLAIAQNQALFSLLGTTYGGDGRTTFGLPDLRGRYMMHMGQGPGLSARPLGQTSGSETTTLTSANLPASTTGAAFQLGAGPGTLGNGTGAYLAANSLGESIFTNTPPSDPPATLQGVSVGSNSGNSQAFNNLPPYQVVNVCIALVGIFPSRS